MDFLSQLRGYYLRRRQIATFHSVIFAGVYDVRNIRQKIREDAEHRMNSPWNIAARFGIDMNFSAEEIAGMLGAYEYPQLKKILYRMLFEGQPIAYSPDDPALAKILMFGFGKVEHGTLLIANRIFETRLYNLFLLTADEQDSQIYAQGAKLKNQFISENGTLRMELITHRYDH